MGQGELLEYLDISKDTVTRYIKITGKHAEKNHDEQVSSASNKRNSDGLEMELRKQIMSL